MFEFQISGVNVQIKFLFVAVITIFLLTDKTGLGVISLISCCIHESGHLLSFYIAKIKPRLLTFDLTGIKLEQPTQQLPFFIEIFILISGSFANYLTAFILSSFSFSTNLNLAIIMINIIIGSFNLLPIKGFDGGKIVFAVLSSISSDTFAFVVCSILDKITTVLLVSLCFFSIFAYELNLSYIIVTLLLIISLVLKK